MTGSKTSVDYLTRTEEHSLANW